MRLAISASMILLAVAGSNAQSGLPAGLISGLSTTCLGGLSSLLTNTALDTCLALTDALTLFAGTSNTSSSLIPDLQTYLGNDICPGAACNATTLSSANSTLTSTCQAELTNGTTIITPLVYLFDNYDVIREGACLKDGSDLCVIDTLNSIQTTTKENITFNFLLDINSTALTSLVQALAANETELCTDCNKALFTTWAPLFESGGNTTNAQALASTFTTTCGNSSLGSIPSTISESATGNSTSSSTSSSSSGSSGSSDGADHGMSISLVAMALGTMSLASMALFA